MAARSAGFIAAAVHHSTDGTRVVNYLQWQTSANLAAMQRSPEFQMIAGRFEGLIEFDPHQCEVVHVGQADSSLLGARPETRATLRAGGSLSGEAVLRCAIGQRPELRLRAIIGSSVPRSSMRVPSVSSRTGRNLAQDRGCASA